jgi:transient receptor potential cation channel subfamily C protein 4
MFTNVEFIFIYDCIFRMGGTFKTVFWSLFGLSEKEGVKLGNYQNRFTELIGYLIYGTFNIASVIVLLNMLIAMMSKSYETIEEHADVEWKFARSKLYMEYIKEGRIYNCNV